MKDPHNTVQRLTLALEAIATGAGSAEERLVDACNALLPLLPDEFPDAEARQLFEEIISLPAVTGPIDQDDAKEGFSKIWRLYWLMSENTEYK